MVIERSPHRCSEPGGFPPLQRPQAHPLSTPLRQQIPPKHRDKIGDQDSKVRGHESEVQEHHRRPDSAVGDHHHRIPACNLHGGERTRKTGGTGAGVVSASQVPPRHASLPKQLGCGGLRRGVTDFYGLNALQPSRPQADEKGRFGRVSSRSFLRRIGWCSDPPGCGAIKL